MSFLLSAPLLYAQDPIRPTRDNTGYTIPENELIASGGIKVRDDGAVIEGLYISGRITVEANNVTIRNCLIETGGFYGITNTKGNTGLLIEDCEIRGMASAAVLGGNFVARRCYVWNSGADGFKPSSNVTIESCYMEKLGYLPEAHADGIQLVGGNNLIVRFNHFDMPDVPGFKNSQCMIIQTNNSPIDNVVVDQNWINGGGFSLQFRDKGRGFGPPTNVVISNNIFGRDYQFGPWQVDSADDSLIVCNIFEDDGSFISNQDSTTDCDASHSGTPPLNLTSPDFSLPQGPYWSVSTLEISHDNEQGQIYITTDGSTPTLESQIYQGALVLENSQSINAIVITEEGETSDPIHTAYEIGEMQSVEDWKNMALPTSQTDNFRLNFFAVPSTSNIDCVIALSPRLAENYADCAVLCRFNNSGFIDARNGNLYEASSQVATQAGVRYHFEVDVNLVENTYSVHVTPQDGARTLIGRDFSFRTEQANAATLDFISTVALGSGSVKIDSLSLHGDGSQPVLTSFQNWKSGFNFPVNEDKFTDDPDRDGVINAFEFLIGTDPLVQNTEPFLKFEKSSNNNAQVQYRQSKAIGNFNITYLVSPDLKEWRELLPAEYEKQTSDSGDFEQVTVVVSQDISHSAAFYQIKINFTP